MICKAGLTCQMSRWAILGVVALGATLTCIHVRAQETKPPIEQVPAADERNAAVSPAETPRARAAASPTPETDAVDRATRDLAAAARQRLYAWSSKATLTLKDGESGRIKVRKNITPVREVLLTPHFEEGGTKFELVGLDSDGAPVDGVEFSSGVLRDHVFQTGSKQLPIVVDGRKVLFVSLLTCSRQDDGSVRVEAKVNFPLDTTPEESEAMRVMRNRPAGPVDPETRKLGEAARKRLTTPSGQGTLTLKDGETERLKIEKNITPVAEILVTPHFEEGGFKFDMVGVDSEGKPVDGVRYTSATIQDKRFDVMSKELPFVVDGKHVDFRSIVNFRRQEGRPVVAEMRVFFNLPLSARESEAMRLAARKSANPRIPETRKLGEAAHKRLSTYPNIETFTLEDGETGRMKIKENITPVAEILVTPHIGADGTTFDVEGLDAHGKPVPEMQCTTDAVPDDAVHTKTMGLGNVADGKGVMCKIQLARWSQDDGRVIAEVKVLFTPHPTPQEMAAMRITGPKPVQGQRSKLSIYGKRPTGNCSIGGRVVSAETEEPLSGARVSLFYPATNSSIYFRVGDDGKFLLENIPTGPYWLKTVGTPGYQDVIYTPEGVDAAAPYFTLKAGEKRLGILLRSKQACRISGKIRDGNGVTPKGLEDFRVLAWGQKNGPHQCGYGRTVGTNGSYVIDGLSKLPVYVMVIDGRSGAEDRFPPVYYPSTFFRSKAKQIIFGDKRSVEGVDITLQREGGLLLEGKVLNEEGRPVPETLVFAHRRDMYANHLTTYTDEQGRYCIEGLGDGEYLVHVDATHRGYVRMRTAVDLDVDERQTTCDFIQSEGVLISGRLVDEAGNDWQIDWSGGTAIVLDKDRAATSFGVGDVFNKYGPVDARENAGAIFLEGEGPYGFDKMIFPTKSTFAIYGMMPGHTKLQFDPKAKDQEVLEIRYQGKDVLETGFETAPGETIDDVIIVIGKK
jgi:carboxypeptidase family protein